MRIQTENAKLGEVYRDSPDNSNTPTYLMLVQRTETVLQFKEIGDNQSKYSIPYLKDRDCLIPFTNKVKLWTLTPEERKDLKL